MLKNTTTDNLITFALVCFVAWFSVNAVAYTLESNERGWDYIASENECNINMEGPVMEVNDRFIACSMAREDYLNR